MNREGVSQAELGRLSGIGQSSISRIILGEDVSPRVGTLKALAKALDTTVGELIGEKREGPLPNPVTYLMDYYDVNEETAKHARSIIETLIEWGRVIQRQEKRAS